ncbi:MAG: hypothetical protein Q9164_002697 [Protoblastenia rupestris]
MTNEGIAQMQMEAGEEDPPLPPIDNVHDPPAPIPQMVVQMDIAIPDAAAPLPAPQTQPIASIPTVAPRTSTPSRAVNGTAEATTPMPAKAASHGAPARRYLNEKVTGVLLEGMKRLAAEQ